MNMKIVAILMAGIVAMAIGVPMAMGGSATQSANVTGKDTTSIDFRDQAGTTPISGWAFTGLSGQTVQPKNSATEQQAAGTNDKAVSRLKNTASVAMDVYLYSGEFNDTAVATLSNEKMATCDAGSTVAIGDITGTIESSCPTTATISLAASGGTKDLYLKLTLGVEGSASASFHADCEMS